MIKRVQLVNSTQQWRANGRYKVNTVVTYLGVDYQNTTGANSTPSLLTDWVVISDCIPLTGTESGNPITGDVEFESESGSIKWIDGNGLINQLSFYESGFSFKNNGLDKLIFLNTTQILSLTVDSSNVNPTDKLIFAQRAYCEKPETLINALNNCDSTQLNTIKTILGI